MLNRSVPESFQLNGLLFQLMTGCGFGLILGIACLRFSVWLVFGISVAALFIYAACKRPEIAVVGILMATSTIIFEEQLPLISVGGMSLHIPDFLLLSLLGLIALRLVTDPEFKLVRTPLDRPLLIFYAVTLLSTFMAIGQASVDALVARRGIRVLSYYLIFFVVTNLVRGLRQLDFLLKGLFSLATVVAGAMVVQFLLGKSLRLLPGRVESLRTRGAMYEDITRILPPGWSIVLVSLVAILCILILESGRPHGTLRFLQLALLGMALLVTFLRSYWAALIIVFVLLAFLLDRPDRQRLLRWGAVGIGSAVMILAIVLSDPGSRASRLLGASLERLGTLGRSGTFQGEDSSLAWRKIENRYAVAAIASHPLVGLGIGAKYRPKDPRLDPRGSDASAYDFSGHVHNGHLWILLQSGLLGYLSLMWLSVVFLTRGFKHWRHIAGDRMRGVYLGFTLAYVVILIAATANSTFMQWRWTPVIGIMMGINELILRKFGRDRSVA
jgi:O-antigen ligase